MKTIIVGDERCPFLYKSGNNSRNMIGSLRCSIDAVALVFANDRDKAHGNYLFVYEFVAFFPPNIILMVQ